MLNFRLFVLLGIVPELQQSNFDIFSLASTIGLVSMSRVIECVYKHVRNAYPK